jgi:hypothetical protein
MTKHPRSADVAKHPDDPTEQPGKDDVHEQREPEQPQEGVVQGGGDPRARPDRSAVPEKKG